MKARLILITGATASGKTTISRAIASKDKKKFLWATFDEIKEVDDEIKHWIPPSPTESLQKILKNKLSLGTAVGLLLSASSIFIDPIFKLFPSLRRILIITEIIDHLEQNKNDRIVLDCLCLDELFDLLHSIGSMKKILNGSPLFSFVEKMEHTLFSDTSLYDIMLITRPHIVEVNQIKHEIKTIENFFKKEPIHIFNALFSMTEDYKNKKPPEVLRPYILNEEKLTALFDKNSTYRFPYIASLKVDDQIKKISKEILNEKF